MSENKSICCFWLISLRVTPSMSIHIVANGRCHSLWLGYIPLSIYTTPSLRIHQWMDAQADAVCCLLPMMLLWTLGCTYLLKLMFSFSSDIYPGVGLLGHMVVLFLVFWGTAILFSIVTASIYIPTISVLGFPFLHTLAWLNFFTVQIKKWKMWLSRIVHK